MNRIFTHGLPVISLLWNCTFYDSHRNFISCKKGQSCPLAGTENFYLCSRSWLMLRQALIKKYPNIQSKTESIQIPWKSEKSNISQLLLFFIQYHLFAKCKEEIRSPFILKPKNFKIWNSSLWKLSKITGRTESYPCKNLETGWLTRLTSQGNC